MTFTGIVTDPVVALVDSAWYDASGAKITDGEAESQKSDGLRVYYAEIYQTESGGRFMTLAPSMRPVAWDAADAYKAAVLGMGEIW